MLGIQITVAVDRGRRARRGPGPAAGHRRRSPTPSRTRCTTPGSPRSERRRCGVEVDELGECRCVARRRSRPRSPRRSRPRSTRWSRRWRRRGTSCRAGCCTSRSTTPTGSGGARAAAPRRRGVAQRADRAGHHRASGRRRSRRAWDHWVGGGQADLHRQPGGRGRAGHAPRQRPVRRDDGDAHAVAVIIDGTNCRSAGLHLRIPNRSSVPPCPATPPARSSRSSA